MLMRYFLIPGMIATAMTLGGTAVAGNTSEESAWIPQMPAEAQITHSYPRPEGDSGNAMQNLPAPRYGTDLGTAETVRPSRQPYPGLRGGSAESRPNPAGPAFERDAETAEMVEPSDEAYPKLKKDSGNALQRVPDTNNR